MRTIDDIKEELLGYKYSLDLIEDYKNAVIQYREKATSCTSTLNDMPNGKNKEIHDKIAEYAAIVADLEKEKYNQLIIMEKNKNLIENNIKKVKQPYQNVLYFNYISNTCKNLYDVADRMNYEYSWMCRLHKRALEEYLKVNE